MKKNSIRLALLGLSLLLASVAMAQTPQLSDEALRRSAEAFELLPGVLVDRSGDALYLMTPRGQVEKLSISNGNVAWTSADAAKPLGLYGDQLLAQAEGGGQTGLRIELLDTLGGSASQAGFTIALPPGVGAGVNAGMGQSTIVRMEIRNNAPVVTWGATSRYSKGVAPGPEDVLEQSQRASYRVDLQSATLVRLEEEPTTTKTVAWPANVQSWVDSQGLSPDPTVAGSVFATTEVLGGATLPSGRIVLKRWDRITGQPLNDLELQSGPHIVQLRSADGGHLLIAERVAPGDLAEYEWSVFSLESGERVGQFRHPQSNAPFFVSDQQLVFVSWPSSHRTDDGRWIDEPLLLRSVLLGSGASVWDRPLRDTSFKGQVPP